MKKPIHLSFFLLFFFQASFSQTVIITEESDRVEGMEVPGITTTLNLMDSREIEKFWTSQLKSYGRMTVKNDFFIVEEGQIPKIAGNTPARIFSRITLTTDGTKIWWGIEFGGKWVGPDDYPSKMAVAKTKLHQFGVDMYVNKVNKEIAEAERVIQIEVKNYESLVRSQENFANEFEKNHLQKIRLQERLAQNRLDSINIVNLIDQNKVDQKLTMEEIQELKGAKEQIKSKLGGIK
jgi:hypothetical protein